MQNILNNYRFTKCPFCNSAEFANLGNLQYTGETEFSTFTVFLELVPEIYTCSTCQSSFSQNTIPPAKAEQLYAEGEGSKRWAGQNFRADKTDEVINKLEKFVLKENTTILDVGSNTGEFLDFALAKKIKTFGLELCEESCKILQQKGHTAYRSSTEINTSFDVVTAFDVVEHVYDPVGFIKFIHKLLNPKGYLVLLTGNPASSSALICKNKWWYFNYPEHVVFPSQQFFKNLSGFELKYRWDVYASKSHEEGNTFFNKLNAISKRIAGNYTGIPSPSPDHQLIVLQKR